MKRKTTKPGNMWAFIYRVSKKMRKVRRKGTIYPHHVQVRNQKGIVRSYINWEWQQLTSKEGMEGVESWRRKG